MLKPTGQFKSWICYTYRETQEFLQQLQDEGNELEMCEIYYSGKPTEKELAAYKKYLQATEEKRRKAELKQLDKLLKKYPDARQ